MWLRRRACRCASVRARSRRGALARALPPELTCCSPTFRAPWVELRRCRPAAATQACAGRSGTAWLTAGLRACGAWSGGRAGGRTTQQLPQAEQRAATRSCCSLQRPVLHGCRGRRRSAPLDPPGGGGWSAHRCRRILLRPPLSRSAKRITRSGSATTSGHHLHPSPPSPASLAAWTPRPSSTPRRQALRSGWPAWDRRPCAPRQEEATAAASAAA